MPDQEPLRVDQIGQLELAIILLPDNATVCFSVPGNNPDFADLRKIAAKIDPDVAWGVSLMKIGPDPEDDSRSIIQVLT